MGNAALAESFSHHEPAVTTIFRKGKPTVLQLRKSKIVVNSGPDSGREFELGKAKITGGRLQRINDIVLSDKATSGTHFEIVSSEDGYRLVDLGSTNGTFINGVRIKEVFLKPGMSFTVGNTELRFQPLNGFVDILLSEEDSFGSVIGSSVKMREIFATLEQVAPKDVTMLITGETGTGKDLMAQSIHAMSGRKDKPLIVLDCGSIPKDLIESTLFGHEKGAFTGALNQHIGCFEQAQGGTIFLDEIGELDISLQPRLLRVLESRELRRVGSDKTVSIDVRVIAATNQNLKAMVNEGKFREDLYYRLSVVDVECPSLRDRIDDIPALAEHFLASLNERTGKCLTFSEDGMEALQTYSWPGNVRELRNVIERIGTLHKGEVIARTDVSAGRDLDGGLIANDVMSSASALVPTNGAAAGFDPSLIAPNTLFKDAKQEVLDEFERVYLAALLERNNDNITRSAQEAGLTRYHLRELLKRHHLAPQQQRAMQEEAAALAT